MPFYIFETPGNPIVRVIAGLITLAVLAALAFFMLPVVLAIIAGAIVLGLIAIAGVIALTRFHPKYEHHAPDQLGSTASDKRA